MSGNSAKKLINWHTGWLGEKDANGDLVGAWAQYSDNEQFKCRFCDVERKYMVKEAVLSNILNLGSRQRLRMGKKEG